MNNMKLKDVDLALVEDKAYSSIEESNYKKNPLYLKIKNFQEDKQYELYNATVLETKIRGDKAVYITVQNTNNGYFYTIFHQFYEGTWLTKIYKTDVYGNIEEYE